MALASCTSKGNFSRYERELIQGCDSIFRVLTIDNPSDVEILRNKSVNLSDKALLSKDFARLSELMIATVTHPSQDGVGIAGPQVGLNRRVIAVQRFDKEGEPFEFFINPEIVERVGEKADGGEGCLSVPELYGNVSRWQQIVLRYRDEKFVEHTERIEGFTAVIFQHEVDHLAGRLFIDYLSAEAVEESIEE